MEKVDYRYWPIGVAIVFLALAAGLNAAFGVVPNWLTFPAILAAWVAGWCISRGTAPSAGGGFGSALLLAFVGLLMLLPFYAFGVMGAGCVKANMALGGWIGCAVSAERGAKWLIGGVMAGAVLIGLGCWSCLQMGNDRRGRHPAVPASIRPLAGLDPDAGGDGEARLGV
jgi:prepilin peptidase CpaA